MTKLALIQVSMTSKLAREGIPTTFETSKYARMVKGGMKRNGRRTMNKANQSNMTPVSPVAVSLRVQTNPAKSKQQVTQAWKNTMCRVSKTEWSGVTKYLTTLAVRKKSCNVKRRTTHHQHTYLSVKGFRGASRNDDQNRCNGGHSATEPPRKAVGQCAGRKAAASPTSPANSQVSKVSISHAITPCWTLECSTRYGTVPSQTNK
mmetsp:Transcript_32436/g.85802  ORF Transcript_32436/g.85802 Transcript_32436/m.85802 type:complete len:205 (-) Transcript_32436:254-868(-)